MTPEKRADGGTKSLYGYVALFNGRRYELRAVSSYAAQLAAVEHFKPTKSKRHLVSVHLAEDTNGNTVTQTPTD